MSMGENIKKLREDLGMSQEELASRMGYSHKSSINKIEMGKQDIPQSKVIELAKIFNINPCVILDYTPEECDYQRWDENSPKVKDTSELYRQMQLHFGSEVTELVQMFSQLNRKGKKKALDSIQDLNKITEYIEKESD